MCSKQLLFSPRSYSLLYVVSREQNKRHDYIVTFIGSPIYATWNTPIISVFFCSLSNLPQGHVNSHFYPACENDEMKAMHLFLDPQTEIDLSEDIMLRDSANDEDCLAIEDFKFATDCMDQRLHCGIHFLLVLNIYSFFVHSNFLRMSWNLEHLIRYTMI